MVGLSSLCILIFVIICIVLFAENSGNVEETIQSEFKIIDRDTWGAHPPKTRENYAQEVKINIIFADIINSEMGNCSTLENCIKVVKKLQSSDLRIYPDIRTNFLIDAEGNIFEGRGWNVKPNPLSSEIFTRIFGHLFVKVTDFYSSGLVATYNSVDSFQIEYLGNFTYGAVTEFQINRTILLLEKGVDLGILNQNFTIYDKRIDEKNLLKDRFQVYEALKKLPNYRPSKFLKMMKILVSWIEREYFLRLTDDWKKGMVRIVSYESSEN